MRKLIYVLLLVLITLPAFAQERTVSPAVAEAPAAVRIPSNYVPIYPLEAKRQHIEGTVVLRVRIGRTGHVVAAEVVSGPELLKQAALDAVNSWVYRPYRVKGTAVTREVTTRVVFTLEK